MNCDYAPTSTRLSTTASLASSRAIPSARINIGWGNGLSSCSAVCSETVRNDKDYSQFALAISTVAIALIAKEHSIE